MGISQAAYARHRGVTPGAVSYALKVGRITVLADGSIDAEAADRQWQERTDPTKPKDGRMGGSGPVSAGTGQGKGTLYESKERYELARAERAELENAETRGELVRVSAAEIQFASVAYRARERLLAIPDRLAPMLGGAEAHRLLTEEVQHVCDELSEPRAVTGG